MLVLKIFRDDFSASDNLGAGSVVRTPSSSAFASLNFLFPKNQLMAYFNNIYLRLLAVLMDPQVWALINMPLPSAALA